MGEKCLNHIITDFFDMPSGIVLKAATYTGIFGMNNTDDWDVVFNGIATHFCPFIMRFRANISSFIGGATTVLTLKSLLQPCARTQNGIVGIIVAGTRIEAINHLSIRLIIKDSGSLISNIALM